MNKLRFACTLLLVSQLGLVAPLYAEPAPVYDADAMNGAFEEAEPSQDLPPPAPPAQDGSYSNTPAQATVNPILPRPQALSIEQRVRRVEQQINNIQNSDMSGKVDSLQGQVQALRGQLEQLSHQLDELQKNQKSQYLDLDKRLSQQTISAKPALAEPSMASAAQYNAQAAKSSQAATKAVVKAQDTISQPNVAEEQKIYQAAYNYIKAKKYNEAVSTLQGMLKKYPTGQFASNAHYWLGELYGLLGKNEQALSEFQAVVTNFADSPRVSDAQLKVGLIYAAQLKWPEAKVALRKVMTRYPGTASARLAKEQLKQIKDAGH